MKIFHFVYIFITNVVVLSQFSPVWQSSVYIEAKSITVVNNNQKTFGTYTLTITFSSVYSTPKIALSIPDIRIMSNSTLAFKIYDSSLTSTGFVHNLQIPDASTSVWYMTSRYIVFNTAVLTQEFQVYFLGDQAGVNILAAPNGSYRTDNYTIGLSPTATLANNPVCLPFLAGFTGVSTDYYQLNLTCAIQVTASAKIIATAYPSTVISLLSFYAIVWDPVVLTVKSYFFVDYAVTTVYYNSQQSFLSLPYGYFDLSYFAGLASFSTSNNQFFNLTLNNLTLTTSASSFYNSVPQLQIRVRNCSQSSYPWYNKADGLCYPLCPTYTYSIASSFACDACPVNCKSCLNGSFCSSCSAGMIVTNNSCVCTNSSYLYSGSCYGCHYSCQTCAATGQYYNCLDCDSNAFRIAAPVSGFNNQCVCKTGYSDTLNTICTEICGDGVARTDACDDGNANSGDGCSSACKIQANFTCTMDASNFSKCYYIANVTLTQIKTFKLEYENTILIYLQVDPWIDAMSQLANSISITSNFTDCTFQYSVSHNLLVYKVSYTKHLEDEYYAVYLNPTSSGIFSKIPSANTTWRLNSENGYKLKVYTPLQYQVAISFHYISAIFGYLILASAFLYIFGRLKWMGNLLFFSLQFQYISMIIIPSFNPMLAGLSQIKTVLGYNEALGKQDFDLPKYPSFYVLNFNKKYLLNVNVMISLQCFALVMYLIYYITYRNNRILCKKYGGDPQKTYRQLKYGKILQFFDWQFFMFWTFFNMTEQITGMILYSQLVDPSVLPLIIFNVICIIFAIAPLIFKRKYVKSYTQLLYNKNRGQEESLISLCCFILMYVLLAISLTIVSIVYYLIFIVPIIMIIFLFCRKPFQSKWMRAAYFINCFCIIITLMYNQLVNSYEDDVYYLPFGSMITILFDWIFNLVVWGRQAYVICKYGGERDLAQLLQQNTKNSSKEEDFFKDASPIVSKNNPSFLNSIMKNQSKSTRRPLNRDELNDDTPQGLRQQRRAILQQQQEKQRQTFKKKRQKWLLQMKQMSNVSNKRQRTNFDIQTSQMNRNKTKSRIRTTGQKGIQQNQIENNNLPGVKM